MLLEVKNFFVKIDDKDVVRASEFCVDSGEIVIISGLNGAGKSTFLKGLASYYPTKSKGQYYFEGQNHSESNLLEKTKAGILYIPQHTPEIKGLSLIKLLYGSSDEKNSKSIIEYKNDIEDRISKYSLDKSLLTKSVGSDMSGGERRKAEMISFIAKKSKLALFDEIDSGVDTETVNSFIKIIKDYQKIGVSFIVVSHNKSFSDRLNPDRKYECVDNEIVKV